MATVELTAPMQPAADQSVVVWAVTVMGTVVGLTFLFGFGNVLNLALRLRVPIWVAPTIDPSILGLLLGTRHLASAGSRRSTAGAFVGQLGDVLAPQIGGEHAASGAADPLNRVFDVQVPQPQGVIAFGDQELPYGGESQRLPGFGAYGDRLTEWCRLCRVCHIPQSDGFVAARGR
jgi:hypothetical protein